MITTIEVDSVVKYIEVIERYSPEYSLSRGQSNDYILLPSALRLDNDGMRLYSESVIKSFLDDFVANSFLYIDSSKSYQTSDWLIHAQHFGVPTQLLDFSYSHLISLMFAVEKAFEYNDDDDNVSVVWLLNPKIMNERMISDPKIVNFSKVDEKTISEFTSPFVTTARRNNTRVAAQNGAFVYFQNGVASLEKLEGADEFLIKLVIPHLKTKYLLKTLFTLGMRFNGIYPELSSVSKDILLKNHILELYKEEGKNE